MTRQPAHTRAFRSLARVWTDIDHAQRRLFEIQTGVRVTRRPKH